MLNLSSQSFSIDRQVLARMQQRINHRGPDDRHLWISDEHQIALAFNRLKIIDLTQAGMQPMIDKDQSVVVCFNGEIYNFKELRTELENLGHEFVSHSDTETIVHGYKQWGIDVMYKLDGMFSIALYDLKMRSLYLIRDRIGVKPLYFSLQGGVLSFASEIKALWELPWLSKEISSMALYHYLTFMVSPAPYTIYKGVYKLPPGYFAKIDAEKNIQFSEWYTPVKQISSAEKKQYASEEFCVENISLLLNDSIKKRMVSDVPFGAFLSGGLDSSLNVALMSQHVDKVKTFTVAFEDGKETNEFTWARLVAQRFGTEHHEIIISEKEAFSFYEQMIDYLDEPLADCVCIPFYYVAKLAKDSGVTVAQVGEGADELFFGYSVYAQYKRMNDYFWKPTSRLVPRMLKKTVAGLSKALFMQSSHQEVLQNWADDRALFWGGAIGFNELQKQSVLASGKFSHKFESDSIVEKIYPNFSQTYDGYSLVDYHLKRLKSLNPDADFCTQMLYLELKQRLPELLLMRADKMSMATSVEARVPFLDHKLVEFMMHVPGSLKFKLGVSKYLLKKVAQGVLPDIIINRPKVGFGAPTSRWFTQGNLFPSYFKQLSQEGCNSNFFTPSVTNLEMLYQNNPASFAVQRWILQNLWALR